MPDVDLTKFFETGDADGLSIRARWVALELTGNDQAFQREWQTRRAAILKQWIQARPGTRPFGWWQCEAPEARRRLGGTGQATYEYLNVTPRYAFGIPIDWWSGGSTRGVLPSVDDPPVYESQADYLARLGMLVPNEAERLPADAFEPEKIVIRG